ncbi:MAG: hypothetical protein VYA84_09745 [Planctomycetota bacterium]|nr:hypothetical protein [Planctomycetota bacterium]
MELVYAFWAPRSGEQFMPPPPLKTAVQKRSALRAKNVTPETVYAASEPRDKVRFNPPLLFVIYVDAWCLETGSFRCRFR